MEDETSVRGFFHLYFRISDEEGTTLDVSVSDERVSLFIVIPNSRRLTSSAQCSVLQDLVPDDVFEDEEAFADFVARLKPLLGDLLLVSKGEARRRPVAQDGDTADTPVMDLTLGTWQPEGDAESRAYIVLKHSVRDDNS